MMQTNISYDEIPVLPRNPASAVRSIMARVQALKAIYEREIGALEASQLEVFLAMQEKKLIAASAYQDAMRALMERKDEIEASIDPILRGQIATMQAEFAEISKRNLDAIARMQRCLNRLGNKICELAQADVMGRAPVGYSSNGAAAGNASQGIGVMRNISTGSGEVV